MWKKFHGDGGMVLRANKIKQIMKKQGITQVDLGKITGIAQPDISEIILGKKERLSLVNAAKIAKALGYSVEYIWPKLFD
ncbi:helix-turn-helix transcriptional regulator [Desulfosporosinus sp.]|uniref:helix-turn-helix transcriptional regulator n=1 Tax=Desulfosporosinus sp. TaxID=157907 RepID=UPI002313DFCF|nr:helix-turn-helix transcriptional regulator [Desulfosporosinus sp.]MDA8224203.1 helix-turn-helix transcriptional regulator [Desulfitobacterium hafniense]